MPTSMTVVATSTCASPPAKRSIAACFSAGRIWPCSRTTSKSASSPVFSRSYSAVAARAFRASDSLDQRADDERLAAGAQLLADALVGAVALGLGRADVGGDRLAAARQLAQRGDVERAEVGERAACAGSASRSCAGDAGTRPSGALASSAARWRTPKRCCSSTTATARSWKITGSSISACVPTISCSSPVARRARISRRRAAVVEPVSSAAVHERARHQRLDRREVLVGQRLGRRHQRGLAAVLDGAQHRVQRDDGLAGADLAHQQPLHRAGAREVGVDVGHRDLLVAGRGERQRLGAPGGGDRRAARSAARRGRRRGARGAGAAGRSGRSAARRRPGAAGRPRGRRSARRQVRSAGREAAALGAARPAAGR